MCGKIKIKEQYENRYHVRRTMIMNEEKEIDKESKAYKIAAGKGVMNLPNKLTISRIVFRLYRATESMRVRQNSFFHNLYRRKVQ